jgi:hypothetical protein
VTGSGGERGERGGRRDISRREALKRIGGSALGMGAGYALPSPVLASFLRRLQEGYEWAFLRPDEVETMTTLADTIIPADGRSGSASDAGTVEYVDFVLSISDGREQVEWHEGLRWLDRMAVRLRAERAGEQAPEAEEGAFARVSEEIRREILDRVAWPEEVAPGLEERAEWFTRVRDLVGAGFFSSRMGVEDVGYMGNVMRPGWEGAPPEALEELGLSYEAWDRKYGDGS